jgi:hypothetical protein
MVLNASAQFERLSQFGDPRAQWAGKQTVMAARRVLIKRQKMMESDGRAKRMEQTRARPRTKVLCWCVMESGERTVSAERAHSHAPYGRYIDVQRIAWENAVSARAGAGPRDTAAAKSVQAS